VVISNTKHAPAEADAGPDATITPAVFHVLLSLARGKSHGYRVMQDVSLVTDGEMRLGPGTLYRSIQRMLVDGLIVEREIALHDETSEDRRRHYQLTPKGLAVAKKEARRLARLVDVARERGLIPRRPGKEDRRWTTSTPSRRSSP
jgi:DNA-binding PadR family transcriptional regulator